MGVSVVTAEPGSLAQLLQLIARIALLILRAFGGG